MTKVVVVTRTKNRNSLLKRALQSVQSQTMKDFVQVVVNDGGEPEAVEQLVREYPAERIKVVHNDKSYGVTKALNKGIQAIKSDYIAVHDDDDTWDPGCLKTAISALEKKEVRGIVMTMDRVIEEVQENEIIEVSRERWYPELEFISLYKQCLDNYLSAGSLIYQRAVYDELGGYDESLEVAEDWDFGIRFLLKYDVHYLKTEKAYINYHHRFEAVGDVGNSVFANVDEHTQAIGALMNRYLRSDITHGSLGIGYIMNSLRYEKEQHEKREKLALEKVIRLEGHMNHVEGNINRTVKELTPEMRRIVQEESLGKRLKGKFGRIVGK